MRLLLDTHIALWATQDDPRLPGAARELILVAPPDGVMVSVVSLWELSIKSLAVQGFAPNATDALERFTKSGYEILDVRAHHIRMHDAIVLRADHKDPFDRMLIAQALAEGIVLVTADQKMHGYHPSLVKVV
jgi:PIN domain nuclease of toxin-antitoxin system